MKTLLQIVTMPLKGLWLLADPAGFVQATTNEKERAKMGIKLD